MKQLFYLSFLLFSILSFGQITDPTPNFDIEWPSPAPGAKWDFTKKPYKKIVSYENSKCIDEFDSIGRHTARTVFWNHVTESTHKKYKGDMMVEFTRKKIYTPDEKGIKKHQDEITINKLNLNEKGKIIDGKTYKLSGDGTYKIVSYQYYDNKNRLVQSKDSTESFIDNYFYSGKNLVRKEEIRQSDPTTKTVFNRTYKYNKDNQIVFYESVKSLFKNNVLTEKKTSRTVEQEYKNKLLVKKVLKDDTEIIERNYTYDNNGNVITFIEIKKNNYDGLITSQTKHTKKYENNILVYSEVQEGLGTQQGKFSFTYYFHSDDESLTKTETTDNKGNIQREYLYNEFNHLIKTITTFSNSSSRSEAVYEIEYY